MTKIEFEALIDKLLTEGIELTLTKEGDIRWYDLNTRMKSHLHIAYISDYCVFRARYDRKGTIYTFDTLMHEIIHCQHGRDYMSLQWVDVIKKWREE